MLRYPTPSDHRYGDATNPAMPQGSNTYWPPGGLDTSQPVVTHDSEDCHGLSSLRTSASATPHWQGRTQTDCQEQFAYHLQQYIPSVNYTSLPYGWAECPAGCADADGQCSYPLGSQDQQYLVSDPSVYLSCDGSFDHYETVTQHPALLIPPSSGYSELGNALVDISTPLHGHSSLRHHRPRTHDSCRPVQDPATYSGFAPSTKVRSCLRIAYSYSSAYRGTRCHRPSLFLFRTPILLVRVSPRHARRRFRLPIRECLHRV